MTFLAVHCFNTIAIGHWCDSCSYSPLCFHAPSLVPRWIFVQQNPFLCRSLYFVPCLSSSSVLSAVVLYICVSCLNSWHRVTLHCRPLVYSVVDSCRLSMSLCPVFLCMWAFRPLPRAPFSSTLLVSSLIALSTQSVRRDHPAVIRRALRAVYTVCSSDGQHQADHILLRHSERYVYILHVAP